MERKRGPSTLARNDTGLPHSLSTETTSNRPAPGQSRVTNSRIGRNDRNYNTTQKRKCVSTGPDSSQFLFNDVFASKRRRYNATHFQPESFEQLRSSVQIQPNNYVRCARLHTRRGLVGQNRHFASILSSASKPGSQMLPSVDLQTRNTGNDLPPVRPKFCSKCFRLSNRLGCSNIAERRSQSPGLFGRFSDSKSKLFDTEESDKVCAGAIEVPGMARQCTKVYHRSAEVPRIPGSPLGPLAQQKAASTKQNFRNQNKNVASTPNKASEPHRSSVNRRHSEFCKLRNSERSAKLPSPPQLQQYAARDQPTVPSSDRSTKRTSVVVRELHQRIRHTSSSPIPLFDDGRLGLGLGGTAKQRKLVGILERERKDLTLQPKGAISCLESTARKAMHPQRENYLTAVGQQNNNSLYTSRRRDKIQSSNEYNVPNIRRTGSPGHQSDTLLYTRSLQQRCRPSVSPQVTSGVASSPDCNGTNFCQMGSTNHRPFRVQISPRRGQVLHVEPERRQSDATRCVRSPVELQPCLGLPAAMPDPSSPKSPEQSHRDLFGSSSTLGSSFLAARPEAPSTGSPTHNLERTTCPDRRNHGTSPAEGQRDDVGSLEMWGWSTELTNWSPEQRHILLSGWRPSTIRTYKPAWLRWTRWSQLNHVSTTNPSGSDVGRFLVDLHLKERLSYNTILLHKSVVSTLCNTNSSHLSSHSVVKHVLKAISIKQPRVDKAPIWDTDVVITHLSKINTETNSLFEASKHAATLLLLCSGRRVHDLTLLKIDPEHCIIQDKQIIFWPAYGSKTDSANHRQSGWKLLINQGNKALDPVFWVMKVKELSSERREPTQSSLFISIRGAPKAASKTTIAGWVKKVLEEAGISATPGSFRAAVASKNWINNFPLDDILARGNWKSENTFAKFYRRQILSSQCNPVSRLFDPV